MVHLHLHTDYSILDGIGKIDEYIKRLEEVEQNRFAITDHGSIRGWMKYEEACLAADIEPIFGCEIYFTEKPMSSDLKSADRDHLLLLVKNNKGRRNLMRMLSKAYRKGWSKGYATVDFDTLQRYGEGLICTSACVGGTIPRLLWEGHINDAKEWTRKFQSVFKDDFFFEIMPIEINRWKNDYRRQNRTNCAIISLAKEMGIDVVATNDCHYSKPEYQDAHDLIFYVKWKKDIESSKSEVGYSTTEVFMSSKSEMVKMFEKNHPNIDPEIVQLAINNTDMIAERCHARIKKYKAQDLFPGLDIPDKYKDEAHYLKVLCKRGMKEKGLDNKPEYVDRLDYELRRIIKKGFPNYFLLVYDLCKMADEMKVMRGPGRGSVVGSLVAYVLDITKIDPIIYGLLFDRFYSEDREDMPDIDLDFEQQGRNKIKGYLSEKYGLLNTASITNYGTYQPKNLLRDFERVMKIPGDHIDKIIEILFFRHISGRMDAKDIVKADLFAQAEEFEGLKYWLQKYERMFRAFEVLKGNVRQSGVHAAGYIISGKKLSGVCSFERRNKLGLVTCFNGEELEKLGLLKLDVLGVKTLDVFKHTYLDNGLDPANIYKDIRCEADSENRKEYNRTIKVFDKGKTVGVFQFEELKARNMLKKIGVEDFNDIMSITSLNRPGAADFVKDFIQGKKGKTPIDNDIYMKITQPTNYVVIYQEQVMRIFHELAGYTLSESEKIRRIIGKKKGAEALKPYKKQFIKSCVAHGMEKNEAKDFFNSLLEFGRYGFNKSHACAYSYISYISAYLKRHYRDSFFKNILSFAGDDDEDFSKLNRYFSDLKKEGMELVRPTMRNPKVGYVVVGEGQIAVGLSKIRDVGPKASAFLESKGPFRSMKDFLSKIDKRTINIRVFKSLIMAGFFECRYPNTEYLLKHVEALIKADPNERKVILRKAKNRESTAESKRVELYQQVVKFGGAQHVLEKYKTKLFKYIKPWVKERMVTAEKIYRLHANEFCFAILKSSNRYFGKSFVPKESWSPEEERLERKRWEYNTNKLLVYFIDRKGDEVKGTVFQDLLDDKGEDYFKDDNFIGKSFLVAMTKAFGSGEYVNIIDFIEVDDFLSRAKKEEQPKTKMESFVRDIDPESYGEFKDRRGTCYCINFNHRVQKNTGVGIVAMTFVNAYDELVTPTIWEFSRDGGENEDFRPTSLRKFLWRKVNLTVVISGRQNYYIQNINGAKE